MKVRQACDLPQKEMWDVADIKNYLKCDEMKAKNILEGYHTEKGDGYGPVEKALILDYIERKQREEREREARYNADIATAKSVTYLEAQVATLEKMCDTSSRDARNAKTISIVAIIVSGIATLASAIIPALLR